MDRKRILEMIDHITEFTDETEDAKIAHPFAVIGPSGSHNSLRVYSYGGAVGRIGLGSGGCSLCDRYYFSNYRNLYTDDERSLISNWIKNSKKKDNEITGKWVGGVLDSDDYLELVLKALKKKFQKVNKSKKEIQSEKERNIQMEILAKGNKGRSTWDIIDVETGVTRKWLKDASQIKNVKKPDFVVYDRSRKQFGIIELKVNNDNTRNLGEHYSMFHALYEDPDYFVTEMAGRASIMADYGLVDFDPGDTVNKVWFGFLFVGGGIVGARDCIRKHLLNTVSLNDIERDCRFLYTDTAADVEDIGLCYECMPDIKTFMNDQNLR